jgi:hypothetical protein
MFAGSLIGVTDRLTTVPVSTLMSAAIETASGESAVPVGGTVVPAIDAGGFGATAVNVSASAEVGPPVITGSPTWFCQVLVPSVMVASRTYAWVWSMVPGSNATANSMGSCVGASIRCSPMITPASGEAVVSTIVTIATASGVSGVASVVVIVPVTVLVAAEIGTATRPVATTATSATRSAAR